MWLKASCHALSFILSVANTVYLNVADLVVASSSEFHAEDYVLSRVVTSG